MEKAICYRCKRTLDDKRSIFPRRDRNGKICLSCEPAYIRELEAPIIKKRKEPVIATKEQALKWLIGQKDA